MEFLTVLCRFMLPNESGMISGPPFVMPDEITVGQEFNEEPFCAPQLTYWRISEDGLSVLYYEEEWNGPNTNTEWKDESAMWVIPFNDPDDLWNRISKFFNNGDDPTL